MKRMALGISAVVLMLADAGFAAQEPQAMSSETRAQAQGRAGHLFDKRDLNHDGKLDQADRAARLNEMFDRIDANHDGAISRAEFVEAHKDMMGHDHFGMAGEHPGGHRLAMLILHRADPGHTGAVSRDAFVNGALALFDQADTNHDGILTSVEHRAFAQAIRQQMRGDWQKHSGPDGDMSPASAPN